MDNKKNVVFVVNNLGYGGAQKMIAFVAESCTKFYDNVFLVSLSSQNTLIPLSESVTVKKLNYENGNNVVDKINNKRKVINHLRKELNGIKPSLICAFGADALLISRLSTLSKKVKLVGSERNSPFSYTPFWKLVTSKLYKSCDGVIFQTHKAMEFYGEKISEKATVIPNPYIRKGGNIKPFIGQRKKTITTAAASFEYRKGIDVLIKAFAIINKRHPDYKLIVYGKGRLLEEYKKLVKEYKLGSSVVFPGTTDNVANEVYDSSVFVLPSRNEGIPNVLIEVMGVGVPTVSCNCLPGGPAFLTDGGRRGLLVDVDDVEAMANSICKVIEDKKLSQELSVNGTEIVQELDPEGIAKQWLEYFEFALEEKWKK
jgi:GalNAc-alpha-(1->4)-GalNAc-alpha-(1->3)-diNAcBac-PP-undecaprenol alpha-1,4-N-acetyl-D-galactosaminyltransferase